MILALQSALVALLETNLPDVFSGATPATVTFPEDSWIFDPLSADPVAGEPGPEEAHDLLPFNPASPAGPHSLTRTPYLGPKRIYLRAATGERVTLSTDEISWDDADPRVFTLAPRADRVMEDFNQLEVLYGVISAATRIKTLHKFTLQISASDGPSTETAFALALAVLTLHRNNLMEEGSASWTSGNYQAESAVKELKLATGAVPSDNARHLEMAAQVELRLQRLLADDEGKPIARILSPGQEASTKPIAIEPDVEA